MDMVQVIGVSLSVQWKSRESIYLIRSRGIVRRRPIYVHTKEKGKGNRSAAVFRRGPMHYNILHHFMHRPLKEDCPLS